MEPINNKLTNNCDKETRIYCYSFNNFQESLKLFGEEGERMSEMDLSSLGLYLCKCVEQEINSSVIQLIRKYLGIKMPNYYCKRDTYFNRYKSFIDTGDYKVSHKIYFNDYKSPVERSVLKTISLGDSLEAVKWLLKNEPGFCDDYPILNDSRFLEIWRQIGLLRNDLAHAGTVCKYTTIASCYDYFISFLTEYMPQLSEIKKDLAPDGWEDKQSYYEIKPAISTEEKIRQIRESHTEISKPKANIDSFKFYMSLKEKFDLAKPESQDTFFDLMQNYHDQFDWTDITFEENGKKGLKDIKGDIVVPAKYDEFYYTSDLIKSPLKTVVAMKNEKFGLVERYSGKELTDIKYDLLFPDETLRFFFYREKGGRSYGLLNNVGEEVIPCYIDKYYDNLLASGFYFQSGEKFGYYSVDNDLLVEPKYDDIIFEDLDEPLIFRINGVEGCISNDGKFYTMEDLKKMEEDDSIEHVEKYDLLMESSE